MRILPFVLVTLAASTVLLAESAAGLKWTAPAGWKSQGSAPFRVVTWSVPSAPGVNGATECIAYFFGPGQGGPVQANLDRWEGQFSQNGKPAPAKIAHRTIHGINVTTIDLTGTYTATGGQVREGQGPQPNYRMMAAVAEGPGGNIFFRFIGPEKSVTANAAGFEELLSSIERQ